MTVVKASGVKLGKSDTARGDAAGGLTALMAFAWLQTLRLVPEETEHRAEN